MEKEFSLPFQPGFEIDVRYALLVGATVITYSRFESTVIDIIGFYRKGYRSAYYCKEVLMPRHVISDLSEIGKPEDKENIGKVLKGFKDAVNLRNAIAHSVPCGGPTYDVLHFQQGTKARGNPRLEIRNSYRGACFHYDFLLEKAKRMVEAYRVASDFFYSLRDRNDKGEGFPGDPC